MAVMNGTPAPPSPFGLRFVCALSRGVGLPVLLYPPVFDIVWRASRKAKRGEYDTAEWVKSSVEIMAVLRASGVDIRVEGLEHVRAEDGPVVFIANHMSTLETFLLPSLIASIKPVTFVVKKSLTTYPIFGHVMRSRDPVTVGRVNAREDYAAVMEGGSARLAAGISMIIFPQAVRSVRFEPENFNTLGVKLARRAGVRVQPIALRSDAWQNGRKLKDLGRLDPSRPVRFRFAPPMPVTGNGAAEHDWIVAYIRACLAEWGG